MEHRATLLAQLAEIQASLTARLDAAAAIMTLTELAEFTGIPETELRAVTAPPVHPGSGPRRVAGPPARPAVPAAAPPPPRYRTPKTRTPPTRNSPGSR